MRRGEIMELCWDRVDLKRRILRVEETKTGEPLELPITRQLAALLERRRLEASASNGGAQQWVFPSTGGSGHVVELQHLYRRISREAGTKFWFHGLRKRVHYGGGAGAHAAAVADQAAGQPRPEE